MSFKFSLIWLYSKESIKKKKTVEVVSSGHAVLLHADTEVKTNLSKGGKSVKETNIDSTSGNTNHVIHTSSSAQSSKELSDKHDPSNLSSSPSPTSIPTKTIFQTNGNDLTLL